ncbi:interleukin-12 subunit alpha [Pygocentrus nattereri]|uniref:interleukin-12 subunit alpha n=1 Tax=Pygocentrus nattereri TaxID=42514 RepID=UPI00081490CA|nr:interleukin-12 subunit alpha [Pygocentrus nattereri]
MYSTALCLVTVALLCGGALANPVPSSAPPGPDAALCTRHARSLLFGLRRVLDAALEERRGSGALFHGFNCTELRAELRPDSQTVAVCQPDQYVTCFDQNSSSFSESECLENIRGDLQHYKLMLRDYVKTLDQKQKSQSITELTSITSLIQTLQEECPLLPKSKEPQTTTWVATDPFYDRMDLCKWLKGLHIRTVTINRVLGYISAGEYKK